MLLEFPVLTEDEIERINMLEPGVYDFKVIESKGCYSSAGNPQFKLILKVLGANGREYNLTDFLVNTEKMLYKIKHFCEATGIDYTQGKFTDDSCLHKTGKVEIVITPKKSDGKKGYYPAKNSVKDYVKLDSNEPFSMDVTKISNGSKAPITNKFDNFPNDEVPF